MRIRSTLGRSLAELPPPPAPLRIYVCGITPYDSPHFGHARSAVIYDAFVRYLRGSGRTVTYVRNITDVDDKIIARAKGDVAGLTARYIAEYDEILGILGCARPDHEPRVSDHIPEIIELIARLIERGSAYEVNGSVYFSVSSFPGYGTLSNRRTEESLAAGKESEAVEKRDPLDFALWKAAKPGEPRWESPWGAGRPGWHIECSAMARRYLGETFEIHGGGVDLVFPHHENERAQSAAATGREPAGIWMHNGLITLAGAKMAKSLGNVISLKDLSARHEPRVLRYFLLAAHYSSPLDVDEERILEAAKALARFENVARTNGVGHPVARIAEGSVVTAFRDRLDDDFNTPRAFAELHDALRFPEGSDPAGIFGQIAYCGDLIGLELIPGERRDARIEGLIAERNAARASRDFARADAIRKSLADEGVLLEDSAEGTKWRRR